MISSFPKNYLLLTNRKLKRTKSAEKRGETRSVLYSCSTNGESDIPAYTYFSKGRKGGPFERIKIHRVRAATL